MPDGTVRWTDILPREEVERIIKLARRDGTKIRVMWL